eukprot:c8527_g1_i1.p1 GENE.c8527_g1_i1~~c8527_g1_i1.p1  ORF type:complete len:135 (+),score=20.57 c8527_g1_i1:310-714(+)
MKQKMDWISSISVQHAQAFSQETLKLHAVVKTEVVRAKMFLAQMQALDNEAQNLAIVHQQIKDMLRLVGLLEAATNKLLQPTGPMPPHTFSHSTMSTTGSFSVPTSDSVNHATSSKSATKASDSTDDPKGQPGG